MNQLTLLSLLREGDKLTLTSLETAEVHEAATTVLRRCYADRFRPEGHVDYYFDFDGRDLVLICAVENVTGRQAGWAEPAWPGPRVSDGPVTQ